MSASALVNLSGPVADPAGVQCPDDRRRRHRCHRHRRQPRSTTTPRRRAVAVTVAVAFGDVGTSAPRRSLRRCDLAGVQCPTQSSTSSTWHRRRRAGHHRHRGRRAGCRHSRSHLRDVGTSALVNLSGPVADPAGVQCPDAVVDVVYASASASPRRTTDTEASSWLPSRSQSPSGMSASALVNLGPVADPGRPVPRRSRRRRHRCHRHRRRLQDPPQHRGRRAGCRPVAVPSGCRHIRTRRSPGPLQTPQASCPDAVVDIVANAIGIGVSRAGPTTDTEGVEPLPVAVTFGDVGTSARKSLGPLHPQASVPRRSRRRRHKCRHRRSRAGPTQTPRASSWLPSQSQSPSGMSAHPTESSGRADPGRPVPRRSRRRRHAIGIGVAAQDPPQTPRASSWLPSQSQSPSGMSAHPLVNLPGRCRPRASSAPTSRRRRHRCHRHRRQPRRTPQHRASSWLSQSQSPSGMSHSLFRRPRRPVPRQSSTSSRCHRHRRQPRRTTTDTEGVSWLSSQSRHLRDVGTSARKSLRAVADAGV